MKTFKVSFQFAISKSGQDKYCQTGRIAKYFGFKMKADNLYGLYKSLIVTVSEDYLFEFLADVNQHDIQENDIRWTSMDIND